jgi:hypothetical protein
LGFAVGAATRAFRPAIRIAGEHFFVDPALPVAEEATRYRANELRFCFWRCGCGIAWGALVLFAVAMARRDYFPLSDPRDTGYILLAHAVPGGVGAFIFSLFTYDRMARFAGKAWGRHRAESRVEKS